jgi:hypothetical protein
MRVIFSERMARVNVLSGVAESEPYAEPPPRVS